MSDEVGWLFPRWGQVDLSYAAKWCNSLDFIFIRYHVLMSYTEIESRLGLGRATTFRGLGAIA